MPAMRHPTLPQACWWIHSDRASYLHFHFGCIAFVDCQEGQWRVTFQRKSAPDVTGMAPSRAKGILYVERWLHARGWLVFGSRPHPPRQIHRLPSAPCLQRAAERAPSLLRPGDASLIYLRSCDTLSND